MFRRFMKRQDPPVPEFERRGSSTDLVVLLHAFTSSPEKMRLVRDVVCADTGFDDADILTPRFSAGRFSSEDPNGIVVRLMRRIDELWDSRKDPDLEGYRRIFLVGHSMGALLVRKLYVVACGECAHDAPFEPAVRDEKPREWAARVERIVLLAGMNRGWTISHHLSISNAFFWTLGSIIGNIRALFRRRQLLIFTIRRGAPFITQLRLQWLAMRHRATKEPDRVGNATTIQLLGSIDDMVSPTDNIDLVTGRDFIYLDVPQSGHSNIIEMDDSEAGHDRRAVLAAALASPREFLEYRALLPADFEPGAVRTDISDVIFVIHGIRDEGYWTHKIARRVKALARRHGRTFETKTSSYGYFAMLPFLTPWRRRAKVEWLMDQYTEAKARYPEASFSFVGHSNGTYLLAKALEIYPSCRFRHIVFAGSVVRRGYDWTPLLESGQVGAILNYVATADWVVAFFPKALQPLRWFDLGSAGHDGFARLAGHPRAHEICYVRGGHAAALQEANWDAIASFIVDGVPQQLPDDIYGNSRLAWVAVPATIATLLLLAIVALVFAGGGAIIVSSLGEWQKTVALFLYGLVIWKVVTRL